MLARFDATDCTIRKTPLPREWNRSAMGSGEEADPDMQSASVSTIAMSAELPAAPWESGSDAHPSGIRKCLLSVFPPSICDDADEMMVFPQRYLGSCLVYEKTESMIGIGIGRGNNGKSDLITLLEKTLSRNICAAISAESFSRPTGGNKDALLSAKDSTQLEQASVALSLYPRLVVSGEAWSAVAALLLRHARCAKGTQLSLSKAGVVAMERWKTRMLLSPNENRPSCLGTPAAQKSCSQSKTA